MIWLQVLGWWLFLPSFCNFHWDRKQLMVEKKSLKASFEQEIKPQLLCRRRSNFCGWSCRICIGCNAHLKFHLHSYTVANYLLYQSALALRTASEVRTSPTEWDGCLRQQMLGALSSCEMCERLHFLNKHAALRCTQLRRYAVAAPRLKYCN